MNERKTKDMTNLNSDEKIIRETFVSLARMYFSGGGGGGGVAYQRIRKPA